MAMNGGSYVPRDTRPEKAREFLGRLFRQEGYSFEDTAAAVDEYEDQLMAMIEACND